MPNLSITIERRVLVSNRKFEDVIASIHAAVGHPDMPTFWKAVAEASTYAELHGIMHGVVGPSGLMEFMRFDHGQFLLKTQNTAAPVAPPELCALSLVIHSSWLPWLRMFTTQARTRPLHSSWTNEKTECTSPTTRCRAISAATDQRQRCGSRPNSTQGSKHSWLLLPDSSLPAPISRLLLRLFRVICRRRA